MAYEKVNGLWPDVIPPMTNEEAISAAKRLYRFGTGRAFKGTVKIGTGNRYTWVRNHVLTVNPNRAGLLGHFQPGWPDVVHFMSHYCHQKLHPTWKPHGPEHHAMERRMVEYVIAQGWLDGKLKRPVKDKPNKVAARQQQVLQGIERWTTKLKRAQTALRKLHRKARYYERSTTQSPLGDPVSDRGGEVHT